MIRKPNHVAVVEKKGRREKNESKEHSPYTQNADIFPLNAPREKEFNINRILTL